MPFLTSEAPRLPVPPTQQGAPNQRLGLHVTTDELAIWQDRAVNGPYKTAGDVSTNSPGDWDRITAGATVFAGDPSGDRWTGYGGAGCWDYNNNPSVPGRSAAEGIRDAAFVDLVNGTTTYLSAITTELLAIAGQAGTDWSNTTKWQANGAGTCASGDALSWEITRWLSKLCLAYDYIRPSVSAANRTTLDTWFTNAATLWAENLRLTAIVRFPNRESDDYTVQDYDTCIQARLTHYGGYTHCDFHEGWANRAANHARLVAMVGIMLNNATFKAAAQRWVKEWLRFNVFADSTPGEMHRAVTDSPGIGWSYTGLAVGAMVTIADMFARIGDTTLYEYSTSLGDPAGLTPAGGPKSLLSVVLKYYDYLDHTLVRYGTTSALELDADHIIDSEDALIAASFNDDGRVIQGNLYWQNARIKDIYMRTAAGAPGYPASPSGNGGCVWCGDWDIYPGSLFLFGQMENLVDPYP